MTKHFLEFKDAGVDGDDPADIVKKALAGFQAAFDDRLKVIETKAADDAKLKERLDRFEAKLNRPGHTGNMDEQIELERKSFDAFLRGGPDKMDDLERKSLVVTNNTAMVPPEFGKEVLKLVRLFSPIRQYARVVTIGAAQVQYPRRTGSTAATWVGEIADRTESEPSYEGVNITPYELATYTDISNQLLEDNQYNLEGELASDLGESFGISEGAAFVKGDGTGKPKGLMNATGIAQMVTGSAAGFPATNPADVLIAMFHALPGVHAQNGVWLMNRTTLGTLRQFKDQQGRYIVLDGLTNGAPVTLLGRPVVEAV